MPHNLRSKYEHVKDQCLKLKGTVGIIYFAEFGHAQLTFLADFNFSAKNGHHFIEHKWTSEMSLKLNRNLYQITS